MHSSGWLAILLLISSVAFNGCSPARRVPQGQYLLDKNVINVDDRKADVGDVQPILKQKPNKRLLVGMRFHLRVYNLVSGGKESKTKEKIRTIIGEAPVILDTSLADLSVRQVETHLRNSGYLNAEVGREIRYRGLFEKNRAVVIYNLSPRERYMIGEFKISIADSSMNNLYHDKLSEALLGVGQPFDTEVLDDERDRITRLFRENGYYYFLPDFIYYQADTTLGRQGVALEMVIDDRAFPGVTIPWNKRCLVERIWVHVDPVYSVQGLSPDTSVYFDLLDSTFTRIYFITYNKDYFKSTIARCIFLRAGTYYNISDAEQSYSRLSELRNFKYINIRFVRTDTSAGMDPSVRLRCDVFLTPFLRQDYTVETQGTNTAGDPGIAASLVYRNRNLMKGAEMLSLRLYGALEVQRLPEFADKGTVINNLPFNTVEGGLDFTLEVPKFLVPFKATNFPKYFKPKSSIKAGFNYQQRPDFTRYVSLTNYSYQWRQTHKISHILTPVELSSIKIFPDSLFSLRIASFKDPKLRIQYSDHLVSAANYSLIYNTQQINRRENFTYARVSLDVAGNLLRALNRIAGSERKDDYYTLFNIRYAQYLRAALDYRQYFYPSDETTLAYRTSLGIGVPYGNLNVLPFEKSFYAGGANGIRAFPLRTLGPGSYRDTSGLKLDRTGDISFESSIEYRFKVYSYLEGAVFLDAGNIWLTWPSQDYIGGDFHFNRFYREIAFGSGLGLRLDFGFFIIRLDAGIPLKDPSEPIGERWRLTQLRFSDLNWNVAIGYPF